ncbi:hypothetical protein MKEN_00547100 [Mycena kentingensis (nom. inval.)]|nr:hypothetical protein MKEN_00547100 [Mycena kentingensis (nom. inval.)]
MLSLPTELLINIFQDPSLSSATLYTLATVSRRLHLVAVPILLAQNGLTDETRSMVINMQEDGMDAVSALSIALYELPKIEKLTVTLPHPTSLSSQRIHGLLPHLARLTRLFSTRLSCVLCVNIHLDAQRYRKVLVAGDEDAGLDLWIQHVEALLASILSSTCASLGLHHGAFFTVPTRRREMQAQRGVLRWLWSKAPKPAIGLKLPPRRQPSLAALNVNSLVFIKGPALRWTLSAFQKCSITSLVLNMRLLSLTQWPPVLEAILSVAPKLVSLALTETQTYPLDQLAHWSAKFPGLRSLTIGWRDEGIEADLPNDAGILPLTYTTLETIRAPPIFLRHLLTHPGPSGCRIPNICRVFVYWIPTLWARTEPPALAAKLSQLMQLFADKAPALHPAFGVKMEVIALWDRKEGPTSSAGTGYDELDASLRAALDRVSALEIDVLPIPEELTGIGLWLSSFPQAEAVRIDLGDTIPKQFEVPRLLKRLAVETTFSKVKINGMEHPLRRHGSA